MPSWWWLGCCWPRSAPSSRVTWSRRGGHAAGWASIAGFRYAGVGRAWWFRCTLTFWTFLFQLHRASMVAVWLLTVAAFALIVIDVGGWVPQSVSENPHPLIGAIATGLFLPPRSRSRFPSWKGYCFDQDWLSCSRWWPPCDRHPVPPGGPSSTRATPSSATRHTPSPVTAILSRWPPLPIRKNKACSVFFVCVLYVSWKVTCIFLAVEMEAAQLPWCTYWLLAAQVLCYVTGHIVFSVSPRTDGENAPAKPISHRIAYSLSKQVLAKTMDQTMESVKKHADSQVTMQRHRAARCCRLDRCSSLFFFRWNGCRDRIYGGIYWRCTSSCCWRPACASSSSSPNRRMENRQFTCNVSSQMQIEREIDSGAVNEAIKRDFIQLSTGRRPSASV